MNEIKSVKELNENEIADMIYSALRLYWKNFPNIWDYVTIDDVASLVAIDLYKCRKVDGVPHIVHYYNTRGGRNISTVINTVAYYELVSEARLIHSTGIFDNDARRNVNKAMSIEKPIGDGEDSMLLGDVLPDPNVNVEMDSCYRNLYDNIPDVVVENVYYIDNKPLTYKSLLKDLMHGYNISNISEKLYKKKRNGSHGYYRDLGTVVKQMKEYMKEYLKSEYNYNEEDYEKGWKIL